MFTLEDGSQVSYIPANYNGWLITKYGNKLWYQHGKLHRLDGPAVEGAYGSKEWWINGTRHRLDGPAWEDTDGTKIWYQHGKLHRLDGPAIEGADGSKEWWINGKQITKQTRLVLIV